MIVFPLGEPFNTDKLLGVLIGIAPFPERRVVFAMRPSFEEFEGQIVDSALILTVNAKIKALRLIGPELVGGTETYGR